MSKKFEFQQLPYSYDTLEPITGNLTWVWLCIDDKSNLSICSISKPDNPLMVIVEKMGIPINIKDVMEHAYYFKYNNKSPYYTEAFWKAVK